MIISFRPGRKPTSSSSEAPVSMAEGTMPWQTSSSKGDETDEHFKYQYHPGGDRSKAPKDAPSALHSVIVPNVTLPKVRTENVYQSIAMTNLWSCHRSFTISTISGGKTGTRGAMLDTERRDPQTERTCK